MFESEALAHYTRKIVADTEKAIADGRYRGPARDEALHHVIKIKEILILLDASVAKLKAKGVTEEQYNKAKERLGFDN